MTAPARSRRRHGLPLAVVLGLSLAGCSSPTPPPAANPATREQAYRANNIGVALLEQLNYADAATAFRDALALESGLGMARLNLSLALLYEQDFPGAEREAAEAATLLPDAPQPPYVLGLIARAQSHNDVARTQFERVRQIDPIDVGASVNVAQIALEDRRYDDAIAALRPIVAAEPYHVTAAYVLGLALTRAGQPEEGQPLLERAQSLRKTGYAVTFGTGYLEQGRYAEAIASTGAESELVQAETSRAQFSRTEMAAAPTAAGDTPSPFGRRFAARDLDAKGARALASGVGGGVTLLDVDGDGDLDVCDVTPSGVRLVRNDGASFSDVTAGSGLEAEPSGSVAIGAVAADIDNDGAVDLYVFRYGGSSLYRNDGKGHFTDITRAAKLPRVDWLPSSAAFVDVDHDGDVDLVVAGLADVEATRRAAGAGERLFPAEFAPAPLQLLRNNRDGTFTDITRDAKLDVSGHIVALVPTDYDNKRDIDLLVVRADAPPLLLSNQRDGTFKDVAAGVGLGGVTGTGFVTATVGDINKDDYPDVFFADGGRGILALSDGRGRFTVAEGPAGIQAPRAAQFVDHDNDGLVDLMAWNDSGLHVLRNLGREWRDVTGQAVASGRTDAAFRSARAVVFADVDRDGDPDAIAGFGALTLWRNSGDDRMHALRVEPQGRVSNRLGIGTKIQARAGSLSARAETSAASPAVAPADVVFGLGTRAGADAVRLLWPSGILQAEVAPRAAGSPLATLASPFHVEELDRKPSSCPFLFTWNGERFEFITDFLGGGEMGAWEAPGVFNHPDPVEYVRIAGEQLRPRDGRLELRVTNELEETLFLDRVQLIAVAHPGHVSIYPNEGMTDPIKPEGIHAVRDLRPPVHVVDDHGHDVRDRILAIDRTYPDDFPLEPIRGYARPHSLIVDLGPDAEQAVVLLTGWTDYAFSSDNVAAQQAKLPFQVPRLEVKGADGRWRALKVDPGFPVGRPQTVPVDLTGQLRPGEHEVRLTTTMRIYWDQIQVGTKVPRGSMTNTSLDPSIAMLRERGFSAEVRPDGQNPPRYDYARTTTESPWKAFEGWFTRVGDVKPLVTASDDQFVIARPGDEVALSFDATTLPPLPAGWTRTFLLKGDGFSKEMDINSATPHTVEPLPFHGMSAYPYPPPERYPDSPAHNEYRERYNTRRVTRPLTLLKGSR